jgi:non-ribosomal peptide synthetase component F
VRPYRDYIAWLQKQNLAEADAYWKRTLKGFTAPTPLFVDRHPGEISVKPDARERRFQVPSETATALHRFARENQLTVNTLVQGVWAMLLSRYSREQDVLFGMVVSGRPPDLSGSESMVGLFVNSLPLRVNVEPGAEVVAFLKSLQDQTAEMRQYEYSPLVDIHAASEVPRGLPLFESILAYQNYPAIESLDSYLTNLKISEFQATDQTSFPLVVQAVGTGTALNFRFCYDANRYDDDTIDRMIGHVHTLLESIVTSARRRVAEVPLLTAIEKQALLADSNASRAPKQQTQCLHERFAKQVEQTPRAIALVCDEQQLTYEELNRQANQLAHYLRSQGVGPEVMVGLCTDRSIQMIVGLLGILKAGGAYVPLDPDYPQARLEFMLEDSRTPLLITQKELLAKLPEKRPPVICIDTDWITSHSIPKRTSR